MLHAIIILNLSLTTYYMCKCHCCTICVPPNWSVSPTHFSSNMICGHARCLTVTTTLAVWPTLTIAHCRAWWIRNRMPFPSLAEDGDNSLPFILHAMMMGNNNNAEFSLLYHSIFKILITKYDCLQQIYWFVSLDKENICTKCICACMWRCYATDS